jgi:thioredoxin-like negative regulator of GroEL
MVPPSLLPRVCFVSLLLVPASIVTGGEAPSLAPTTETSGAQIRWEKSFGQALKKARTEGRPVLVDFWADWCHWCHELDATTYRDPAVVKAAAAFVAVKVDTEGSLGDKQVSADYGVEILPTIGFLSPHGRVILLRDKFEGPEAFTRTLETAERTASDVMGWEAALDHDGNDPLALARLGAHLVAQQRFDEGRELLERAAKHDAARPVAERKHTRTLLGSIQSHAARYAAAEKLLQSALDLQPADVSEDAAALVRLGEAYAAEGRSEPARAAWTRALALEPRGDTAERAQQELAKLGR